MRLCSLLCLILAPTFASQAFRNATVVNLATKAPWTPRSTPLAFYIDSSVFLLGGYSGSEHLQDGWYSNDDGGSWNGPIPASPSRVPLRFGAATTTFDAKGVVAGGVSAVGATEYLNDVWTIDKRNFSSWTLVTEAAEWPARSHHCLVPTSTKLTLFGGMTPQPSNDVWSSDNGRNWTLVTSAAPWSVRGYSACSYFQSRLVLVGGTNLTDVFGDVWSSKDDGKTWTNHPVTVESTPLSPDSQSGGGGKGVWQPRANADLHVLDGRLWLLTGLSGSDDPVDDVWYTSDLVTWSLAVPSVAYGSRFGPGTVLTSTGILVLGGAVPTLKGLAYRSDVWRTTLNLLCAADGLVCSGHGNCSEFNASIHSDSDRFIPPPPTPAAAAATSMGASGVVCSCRIGWSAKECNVTLCSSDNCIHGHCYSEAISPPEQLSLLSSVWNGSDGVGRNNSDLCICNTGWAGHECVIPICRSTCDRNHGGCRTPGGCDCDKGWSGADCKVQLVWYHELAQYVADHVDILFPTITALATLIVISISVYSNYWRRAPYQKRQQRLNNDPARQALQPSPSRQTLMRPSPLVGQPTGAGGTPRAVRFSTPRRASSYTSDDSDSQGGDAAAPADFRAPGSEDSDTGSVDTSRRRELESQLFADDAALLSAVQPQTPDTLWNRQPQSSDGRGIAPFEVTESPVPAHESSDFGNATISVGVARGTYGALESSSPAVSNAWASAGAWGAEEEDELWQPGTSLHDASEVSLAGHMRRDYYSEEESADEDVT